MPSLIDPLQLTLPSSFQSLPDVTLAAILDQSVDCVKLIGVDGTVLYMNRDGQCAMEIDDFCAIAGQPWAELWPEEARPSIDEALAAARTGVPSRFDAYCPTAKGSPRWWDVMVSPVDNHEGRFVGYLAVSRDVTQRVLAAEGLKTAADEMRHRLRNSYAMVGGLCTAFARGSPYLEAFAQDMIKRLNALAAAQTILISKEAEPCRISELIPALISPFANPGCPINIGHLSSSTINQEQANAIALVLGELAVNSTKYGALSDTGQISVQATEAAGSVCIVWSELSSRKVEARNRAGGQGQSLMRRIVGACRGAIDFEWQDYGLEVTIRLELSGSWRRDIVDNHPNGMYRSNTDNVAGSHLNA